MPSELQEQVQASRARFLTAVEGVDPTRLETVAVVGVWTPRDVAGNVTDWNWELLRAAQAALSGIPAANQPIGDPEAYNQNHAAARKGDSWDATRADLDRSFTESLLLLEALTSDQLEREAQAPWNEPTTIAALFAVIPEHANEHAGQLEAWRATGQVQ
jgi:hypothetical protein